MKIRQILDDIRVIDLSRHISGPYCSSLLADMGAEVVRVEVPGGDEDRSFGYLSPTGDSYAFVNRMRNKKAITLNLARDEGKEILKRLVMKGDVVLENFAVRDKEKFGLDFESLKRIKPSIILASISAFGLDGPNKQRIGFDPIAQAISGSMNFNGFPGNPPTRTAVAWVDYATAVHMAFGILLAFRHRDRTGEGQVIDVALADVAAGLVALHGVYAEYDKLGVDRQQIGNSSPYSFADSFRARDGWVFISLTRDGVWKRFLKVAGMEELTEDSKFSTDMNRAQNSKSLGSIISPWVREKNVTEVVSLLAKAGVPCSRINSIPQAFSEDQYRERGVLLDMEHHGTGRVSTLGVITKLSRNPGKVGGGAPLVGQHNDEIYKDLLGYCSEDIARFKAQGII